MIEIAILSGKGGTGKTSLSAAFATMHHNTVVADCDVDAANLHLLLQPQNYLEKTYISGFKAVIDYDKCTNCGVCMSYCRFDAISEIDGKISIRETSCDGCKLCSRMCAAAAITMEKEDNSRWYAGDYRCGKMVHARLAPGEENSGKLVGLVREHARELSKSTGFEIILIDGPPGTGCPAIASIAGVNKAIIVTEPTNSGFHDMKRILKLTAHFRVKSFVVINKYDLNLNLSQTIEQWCKENNIPMVGKLAFNEQIVAAMLNCQSIVEYQPDSESSKEIYSIYKKVYNA